MAEFAARDGEAPGGEVGRYLGRSRAVGVGRGLGSLGLLASLLVLVLGVESFFWLERLHSQGEVQDPG